MKVTIMFYFKKNRKGSASKGKTDSNQSEKSGNQIFVTVFSRLTLTVKQVFQSFTTSFNPCPLLLAVYDSTGKYPTAGMLTQGNLWSIGSPRECLNLRAEYESFISGKNESWAGNFCNAWPLRLNVSNFGRGMDLEELLVDDQDRGLSAPLFPGGSFWFQGGIGVSSAHFYRSWPLIISRQR